MLAKQTSRVLAGAVAAPAALEIAGLVKSFAGTQALKNVDLLIAAGEIHGLVGPNGSGKSTLVKILSGFHQADRADRIAVGGRELTALFSARDIEELGVGFVHQDLALIDDCSIADNLAFGARGFQRSGVGIAWRRHIEWTRSVLDRVNLRVDPLSPVGSLLPAERTLVAVGRALAQFDHAHLLVLDEPTARLPHHETEMLLDSLRIIAAEGTAILYITHRLSELFAFSERITAFRDGRSVARLETAKTSAGELTDLMTGNRPLARSGGHSATRQRPAVDIAPIVALEGVSTERLRNVSLALKPGSILALTGAVGCGSEHCAEIVYGLRRPLKGRLILGDQPTTEWSVERARKWGIAYLPPDRATQGGFMDSSVAENILIADYRPVATITGIDTAACRTESERVVHDMSVWPPDPEYALRSLSGGNQQKVLLGKWLRIVPRVLVVCEPTQGVDVMSRRQIYSRLERAKADGLSVLWVTSDIEEAVEVADTIAVLFKGRIVLAVEGEQADLSLVNRAAMGG